MADSKHTEAARSQLQAEHQELLTLFKTLGRRLDGPPWQDPMIVSLLESLREHLGAHFDYEESDDGFDHLLRRAPWLSAKIEALLADHRRLMSASCDLVAKARAERTVDEWTRLRSAFACLYDELRNHEAREQELLQEAYTQDIGDKD